MQKGSAQLLFLVLGFIIILAGVYFYFNKSTNTNPPVSPLAKVVSNIDTYKNESLGFEFEYSKDLTLKEDSEEEFDQRAAGSASKSVNGNFRKNFKGYIFYEPGKFLGGVVVLDKDNSYETNPLTLWVFDNPDNKSIEDWYKNYWYYPFVWGDFTSRNQRVAPVNEATISGQLAKSGVVDYRPGEPKFIYIAKDNKMYLFRIIGDEGEKILESFKFL